MPVCARARRHQSLGRWLIHRAPSARFPPSRRRRRFSRSSLLPSPPVHTRRVPARSLCRPPAYRRWCEFLNAAITGLDSVRSSSQNCILWVVDVGDSTLFGLSRRLLVLPSRRCASGLVTTDLLCSCRSVEVAACGYAH